MYHVLFRVNFPASLHLYRLFLSYSVTAAAAVVISLSFQRQGNHSSEVIDLAGGSESPRSQTYSPSFTGGGSGSSGGGNSPAMVGRTLEENGQRWSDQRHQQHQQQIAGVGTATHAAPVSSTLQQTHNGRRGVEGTGSGDSFQPVTSSVTMRVSSSSAGAPSVLTNERSGGTMRVRQGDGRRSSSLSPRGTMFSPTSSARTAGEASIASEEERQRQQQQQREQEVDGAEEEEESEGVQQVRHLVRVRQAMLGGGDAGIAVDGGNSFSSAPTTWGIATGGGGSENKGSGSGMSDTPGSAGDENDCKDKDNDPQDDPVSASGTVADASDSMSTSLAGFDDQKSAAMSQGTSASAGALAADTASVSDGIVWELAGADGTAASDAALDEEFWAADAGGDGADGGGGSGVDGRIDADGVADGPTDALAADDGLWGFDDRDGGPSEHIQKKPRVD